MPSDKYRLSDKLITTQPPKPEMSAGNVAARGQAVGAGPCVAAPVVSR